MFNILILGSNGQIGSELATLLPESLQPSKKLLDITDRKELFRYLDNHKPDVIFNCAAWTDVKKAESNFSKVYDVNVNAVETLSMWCKTNDALLVHYSSNYIFDNKDEINPRGVYAKSKLLAEQVIKKIRPNHLIIRTANVYNTLSEKNLIYKLVSKIKKKERLSIANIMVQPTLAKDIAEHTLKYLFKESTRSHQIDICGELLPLGYIVALIDEKYEYKSTEDEGYGRLYSKYKFNTTSQLKVHIKEIFNAII